MRKTRTHGDKMKFFEKVHKPCAELIDWYILTFVALFVIAPTVSLDPPVVRTKYGQIRGLWSKSAHNIPIANFLGVPYARPPVKNLRFKVQFD